MMKKKNFFLLSKFAFNALFQDKSIRDSSSKEENSDVALALRTSWIHVYFSILFTWKYLSIFFVSRIRWTSKCDFILQNRLIWLEATNWCHERMQSFTHLHQVLISVAVIFFSKSWKRFQFHTYTLKWNLTLLPNLKAWNVIYALLKRK